MKHYKLTNGILLADVKEYTDEHVIVEYGMEQGSKKQVHVLRDKFVDLDTYIKSEFSVIEVL